MTLAELKQGDRFNIIKITIEEEIGKRLVDMGLNQGVAGEMIRCALFGDPIEIRIRNYNLSLRKAEAAGVEVELAESGKHGHQYRRRHGWKQDAVNPGRN